LIDGYAPIGWLGASDCTSSTGWACDPDNYNQPLEIRFYRDGPAGIGPFDIGPVDIGVFIGSVSANQPDSAAGEQCGGNSNHGFSFPTPASLKDGISHTIYAYAINIGSGTAITMRELVHKIVKILGGNKEIIIEDERQRPEASEVMRLICDNRRARELLHWEPQVSLDEGLRRTIEFIREHLPRYKPRIYNL
jgi:hypothetical protein